MSKGIEKILLLRKMKDDFTFTANYTQMLADKLVEWGYSLYIYDLGDRKIIDYNNKKTHRYYNSLSFLDKTPFRVIINIIAFIYFSFVRKNAYDICHIMYVRLEYLLLPKFVKRLAPTLFISIFGSDIHKYDYIAKHFRKIYSYANKILITNGMLKNDLEEFFREDKLRNKMLSKVEIVMFPLKSIQILEDGIHKSRIDLVKKNLNIPDNKAVIMCGNTARIEYEQYDSIVKSLKGKIGDKEVVLIFSLTYGGSDNETKRFIREAKRELPDVEIRFLTEYLELSDLLALRTITDIYINVRKHDQFVASMIEALHCGSHVITGSWLNYEALEKENFVYYPINKPKDTGQVCLNILEDINKGKANDTSKNRELVNKLWHPSSTLKQWEQVYNI